MKPRQNVSYATIAELYAAKRAYIHTPRVWAILGCIVGFIIFTLGAIFGAILCH